MATRGKQTVNEELNWLAGVIDGDGSIFSYITSKKVNLKLVVAGTDEAMIARCREVAEVGKVYYLRRKAPKRPQWRWELWATGIDRLLPRLTLAVKHEQADLALSLLQAKAKSKVAHVRNPHVLELARQMSRLNARKDTRLNQLWTPSDGWLSGAWQSDGSCYLAATGRNNTSPRPIVGFFNTRYSFVQAVGLCTGDTGRSYQQKDDRGWQYKLKNAVQLATLQEAGELLVGRKAEAWDILQEYLVCPEARPGLIDRLKEVNEVGRAA